MEILKNQTLYKCSFCSRRMLTKKGAEIHENDYCKSDKSPRALAAIEKQNNCEHKNSQTHYSYIPGEAVQQPECDICTDCGLQF